MQTIWYFLNLPVLLLLYAAAAGILAPDFHGVSVVLGIPSEFSFSGVDYTVFGRWLLLTGIPVLVNGLLLERGSRIEIFMKIRGRGRKDFCRKMAGACILVNTVWCCFLMLFLAGTKGIRTAAEAFPLVQTNLMLWESVQLVFYFRINRSTQSAASGWITILLNGLTCLAGVQVPSLSVLLPPFWGMLCRNNPENGYMQYGSRAALNLAVFAALMLCLREREE